MIPTEGFPKRLLLDLLSPVSQVNQNLIDTVDSNAWASLSRIVRQHRIGPLLHWQLKKAHNYLDFPIEIRSQFAKSYQQSAIRSLALQRELLFIHRILNQAEIPYVALKGAYLAYHAYPESGLRPLRDLDILVPKKRVLQAYQILIQAGLVRIDKYMGMPDAAALQYKHLPPLRSVSGMVIIEVHSRLFRDKRENIRQPDLSDDPAFWLRSIRLPMAHSQISFESPTDLLLDMIVHAVYDHQFDNGPLLLSDLAFLISTQPINWPLFWTLSKQRDYVRGCILALRLTQRYWNSPHIEWPIGIEHSISSIEGVLDVAESLMLRDVHARGEVSLGKELKRACGISALFRLVLHKVFPTKIFISANYPVLRNDSKVYLWYLVRWWHLITDRLPELWKAVQKRHIQNEVSLLSNLEHWLENE